MINEKGIISLTALCMMLIVSLMIAGTSNIAARQADITRYYKLENQLQCAADSAFNEVVAKLSQDSTYSGKLRTDDNIEDHSNSSSNNPDYSGKFIINDVTVNIYIRKIHFKTEHSPNSNEDTHYFRMIIMSLAEKENYNYGKYSVYKRVFGYLERKRVRNRETNDIVYEDEYKFKEYLY